MYDNQIKRNSSARNGTSARRSPVVRGFALVISAPSGAGKSTVCRKLLERDEGLRYSVSCTTRPPRPGEKDGRDYHFLDADEFKRRMHRHEFLEWAHVHDHYYGTPRRFLDCETAAGRVVVLAIDVQGAESIRRKLPETVTVFLLPPSWRSLEQRLHHRRQDAAETVKKRLSNAPAELSQAKNYDYLVVNDNLDRALQEIESIIAAERLRTQRRDLAAYGIKDLSLSRGCRR